MALPKGSKFVVVENAGRDNEYVRPIEFKTLSYCSNYLKKQYTKREIEDLNVRISLKLADGTITTEF